MFIVGGLIIFSGPLIFFVDQPIFEEPYTIFFLNEGCVVQKYDFGYCRGNDHETDFTTDTYDFAVNAAYILVAVN